MKTRNLLCIQTCLTITTFLFLLFAPQPILAQGGPIEASKWTEQGCSGGIDPETGIDNTDVVTIKGIQCILLNLLQFLPPLIIFAALGMIIYSGARMIMGADNPKEVAAAQQTFTFAIIGLIGIGLAWIILILIEQFTSAPVTELNFTTNP